MKFITSLIIFLALFLSTLPTRAIEEVVLEINGDISEGFAVDDDVITDEEWFFDMGGKTLQQKLQEIRAKEHKNIGKSHITQVPVEKSSEFSTISGMHHKGTWHIYQ